MRTAAKLIADVMQYEAAPLFPDPDGKPGDPTKAVARLTRWTFDLAANSDRFKRRRDRRSLGRISAPRRTLRRLAVSPWLLRGARHQRRGAGLRQHRASRCRDRQAHVSIDCPKATSHRSRCSCRAAPSRPKATAICSATVWRGADKRSDLAVFDAAALDKGPVALAELSHRVPFGFHGNWRASGRRLGER